jgi:hypothetical protein
MPPNMQKRIRNEVAEVNEDTTINMMVYVPDESNTCKYCHILSIGQWQLTQRSFRSYDWLTNRSS